MSDSAGEEIRILKDLELQLRRESQRQSDLAYERRQKTANGYSYSGESRKIRKHAQTLWAASYGVRLAIEALQRGGDPVLL